MARPSLVQEAHHHLTSLIVTLALNREHQALIPFSALGLEYIEEADRHVIAQNATNKFLEGPQREFYDFHVVYIHSIRCFYAVSMDHVIKQRLLLAPMVSVSAH